jgi:hypothetical protein
MYFSPDAIKKLADGYRKVAPDAQKLAEAYYLYPYKIERAREFANHGFSRRLSTMVRCIEIVFDKLPPEREQIPTKEERLDATISIQAFMFNAFGSIDNLAWVWVSEKELDVYKLRVGLGPNNIAVRKSLSSEFQEYLKGLDPWFAHLEDFRHALAHRISLYVPPYIITLDKETDYRDLEKRINESAGRGNFEEYNKLLAEQTALGVFRPWMLHSTVESPGYVPFHPQLIADFNTIEELGRKMIDELRR